MNKKCQIAGIKMIARKNYGVSSSVLDLEAHIDSSLSYSENFANIKPKILMLRTK